MLRTGFMDLARHHDFPTSVQRDEPMYPVPAEILARALHMLDQANIAQGRPMYSDEEISAITGHCRITRGDIIEKMDLKQPVLVPADFLCEIGNYVDEAGEVLYPPDSRENPDDPNPFYKVKLEFLALFLDSRINNDPSPAAPHVA